MATSRICSIPDCGKPMHARGWCSTHYWLWRMHGDPLGGATRWGEPERYLREQVLSYTSDDCLIWPFARSHGYAIITRNRRNIAVSRLVCEDEHGPPPTPRHQAAHSCGKGHLGCITRGHLRWATRAENMADCLEHGTRPRGERHGRSKLTEDDVRNIRRLKGALVQRDIAELFGISQTAVGQIHRRAKWSWLP